MTADANATTPIVGSTPVSAKPPLGAWAHVRALGPGILVGMAWLGAGDLVDSAVSGGNYGYALMWALALALFSRYFFTSAIAKYGLCNAHNDETVIAGFGRLWKPLPMIMGIGAFISGFILQTYMVVAVGTSLYAMTGFGGDRWGPSMWTVVAMLVSILILTRKKAYSTLELIARIKVAVLVIAFLVAAGMSHPDGAGILRGLAFEQPPKTGLFTTGLVAAAIIGAVGGSAGNLMYPEFMRDRGWRGPAFLKIQRIDLLVGTIAVIVVDLAIWVVGAQILHNKSTTVSSLEDLAQMMKTAIGPVGWWILWLGVMLTAFVSFSTYARGYTKILFSGIHQTYPQRQKQYGSLGQDPLFRWLQIGVMTVIPIVFSLPAFPDVLVLTVAGSATAAIMAPVIILGTIILLNMKSLMRPGYVNRWWENVLLVAIGGIGLYATYGVVTGLPELFS